jgi:hypothetical protein
VPPRLKPWSCLTTTGSSYALHPPSPRFPISTPAVLLLPSVRKATKVDPRRAQDCFLKCLQRGRADPLAAAAAGNRYPSLTELKTDPLAAWLRRWAMQMATQWKARNTYEGLSQCAPILPRPRSAACGFCLSSCATVSRGYFNVFQTDRCVCPTQVTSISSNNVACSVVCSEESAICSFDCADSPGKLAG